MPRGKKNRCSAGGIRRSNTVKIAVTCFREEIAPCFAASGRFMIWELLPSNRIQSRYLSPDQSGGLSRIRLLQQEGVDVLICNGIENQEKRLLQTSGCHVVDNVVGSVGDALHNYFSGRLSQKVFTGVAYPENIQSHSDDLVKDTMKQFMALGWIVTEFEQGERYPVDFSAKRDCPICGNVISAAVCCGAHLYGFKKEIFEFHQVTCRDYHARVFIHPYSPKILEWCMDFGVELIDPALLRNDSREYQDGLQVPPLRGRIKEHKGINLY